MLRRQQALGRRLAHEVKAAERRVAADVITPLIEEIGQRYGPEIQQYLAEVREHMLDNLDSFREQAATPGAVPVPRDVPGRGAGGGAGRL